jgi:hypothetical protein
MINNITINKFKDVSVSKHGVSGKEGVKTRSLNYLKTPGELFYGVDGTL